MTISPAAFALALSLLLFGGSLLLATPSRAGRLVAGAGILTASWNGIRIAPSITLSDALLVAAVPLLLSGLRGRPRFSVYWSGPRSWLLRFSSLLFVGGVLGGIVSPSPEGAGFDVAIRFMISVSVVSIVVWLFVSDRHRWMLASYLFALGVASSTVFGFISGRTFGITGRAVGLTLHPNHLGLSAIVALALALPTMRSNQRFQARVSKLLIPILVFAILGSGSRAALIGAAVWFGMLVAMSPRVRARATALTGLALVASALVLPSIIAPGGSAINRLFAPSVGERDSFNQRSAFYGEAFDLVRRNPLFGEGFENALKFHSVPLQVVVAAGLVGAISLILAAAGIVRIVREATGPCSTLSSRSSAAGIVGTLTMLIVSNQLFDRYLTLALAMLTVGVFDIVQRPSASAPTTVAKESNGLRR